MRHEVQRERALRWLPEFGSERHGELYLRIEVHVPEQLSREERELYERLRDAESKAHKTSAGHWWQGA